MTKDLKDSQLYEGRYRLKESRASRRFWAILAAIVLVFLGLRIYWVNNFGGVKVDGPSMRKTLTSGQRLLMEYVDGNRIPKRGDVIVVDVSGYEEVQALNENRSDEDKLKFVIKRLIAMEGDEVRCTDGRVEIKYAGEEGFTPLDEPYAYYPNASAKKEYDFDTYTVGDGEIFFLGDNRTNSRDSRYMQEGGSNLVGRLYEAKDIVGVVPTWAINNQKILEKIFF